MNKEEEQTLTEYGNSLMLEVIKREVTIALKESCRDMQETKECVRKMERTEQCGKALVE